MEIIKGAVAGRICSAMPVWMLVADKDVRILYRNQAAANLVGRGKIYKTRLGEILNCLHSAEGCGLSDDCRHCPVRGAVNRVMKGGSVERRRTVVTVLDKKLKTAREIPLLVTASPIRINRNPLCLLLLEDMTELTELRGIIPICASCKRIRNGREYWEKVENYIKEHLPEIEFSHGLCPECFAKLCKKAKQEKTAAA